jgi:hypothetical protein
VKGGSDSELNVGKVMQRRKANPYIQEIESQTATLEKLWERLKAEHDEKLYAMIFNGWKRGLDKRDKEFLSKRAKEPLDKILLMINKSVEEILAWLKSARGKPGRHPDPFNVLCYHIINKYTQRKIVPDREKGGRRYLYKKDGQHKLGRNWQLILFFLLDIHLHSTPIPHLEKFVSKNKNKSAVDALRILKTGLWNSYKNFPPLEGWPFPRKRYETGFRKLIVKDDGRLKIGCL